MNTAKLIKVFRAKQKLYQRDPVLFAKEVVGYEADVWQADTLRDLADPDCRRVSVRSGQGVGKTATEAIALLWFLSCFPFARVVATAPTRQQLNDVLWSEIAKWQAKSPMLNAILRWTKTYVFMTGMEKRWFAVARTATKPENMQGFHEENMLFIVDEASGVAEPIMEAILGTLSGPNNKLLLCGNPTKTSGTFYDSHTNAKIRPLYRSRRVSSRDVARTDKENIEMLERRYGKESNVVRVRVDGEFPLQEDDVFIPIHMLERSIKTDYEPRDNPLSIQIGVDVARFGDDKTVISYRVSLVVSNYIFHRFHLDEGDLTKIRASMVCEKSLFRFAQEVGLGEELLLGRGEEQMGGRTRPSIVSDAFEALIAAIFLDGGLEPAGKFVLRFVREELDTGERSAFVDYKTMLQEIVQKNPEEKVSYVLVGETGPDHDKHFVVEVRLNSNVIGRGESRSKKGAEQLAAKEALELMGR